MARNQLENRFRFSISWIFNPQFKLVNATVSGDK